MLLHILSIFKAFHRRVAFDSTACCFKSQDADKDPEIQSFLTG